MKIRNILLASVACALPLVGLYCMGGTSESGNARCVIVGSITNNQGTVGKVIMKLVAEEYVPGNDTAGKIFTTLTDSHGGYRFEDIPMGRYYLNSQVGGKKFLRGPIEIAKPEVTLSADTLCATAQVTMHLPDTGTINAVFLKGTTESWTVGSKTVTLDSIPSGDISIIGFTKINGSPQTLTSANSIQLTIAMAPADTVQAAFNNPPPNIVTQPGELSRTILITDSAYTVTINANASENGPVRFNLIAAPVGMSIDSLTGKVTWIPANSIVGGLYRIGVQVSESRGSSRSIWWTITVAESAVPGPDTMAPVIKLIGSADTTILVDTGTYIDPGVIATDNADTGINHKVVVSGSVDKSVIGVYTLYYNVADADSNAAEMKSRVVRVIPLPSDSGEAWRPEIILLGKNPDTIRVGETWKEPGYKVWDTRDTNGMGAMVTVTGGPVVTNVESFFTLIYTFTNLADNAAMAKARTVVVVGVKIE